MSIFPFRIFPHPFFSFITYHRCWKVRIMDFLTREREIERVYQSRVEVESRLTIRMPSKCLHKHFCFLSHHHRTDGNNSDDVVSKKVKISTRLRERKMWRFGRFSGDRTIWAEKKREEENPRKFFRLYLSFLQAS